MTTFPTVYENLEAGVVAAMVGATDRDGGTLFDAVYTNGDVVDLATNKCVAIVDLDDANSKEDSAKFQQTVPFSVLAVFDKACASKQATTLRAVHGEIYGGIWTALMGSETKRRLGGTVARDVGYTGGGTRRQIEDTDAEAEGQRNVSIRLEFQTLIAHDLFDVGVVQ